MGQVSRDAAVSGATFLSVPFKESFSALFFFVVSQ